MKLKSLRIQNFRALEDFTVTKLGRVNLIVGKNNSGKSSVLEALRIYAGNANNALLEEIAESHDEKYELTETERGEISPQLRFESFFSGRKFPDNDRYISIGSVDDISNSLRISHGFSVEYINNDKMKLLSFCAKSSMDENKIKRGQAISITKGIMDSQSILIDIQDKSFYGGIIPEWKREACSYIPTSAIPMNKLADMWDKIVFTEHAEVVKKSLKIIFPDIEDLTFIKSNAGKNSGRTAMLKVNGISGAIPLKSMGDGALRVLQIALSIFPAKDGFLLIDEFENGLHYSVQEKVWNLLFELAQQLDIQVFATTHSWDCIESFAKVACERNNSEGVLFRVGRSVRTSDQGRVIATEFDEEQLANLTQADVEVR